MLFSKARLKAGFCFSKETFYRILYLYKVIVINKSSSNTVVLTLTEKVTLSNPVFLFRFISDANRTEKAFIASDTSSWTDRYNKFTIIDNASENALNGQMDFDPTGSWTYEVYEQSSSSNLNVANATSKLETGKVNVIGTKVTINKHQNERTFIGYGTGS